MSDNPDLEAQLDIESMRQRYAACIKFCDDACADDPPWPDISDVFTDYELALAALERVTANCAVMREALELATRDVAEWLQLGRRWREEVPHNHPVCPTNDGLKKSVHVLEVSGKALCTNAGQQMLDRCEAAEAAVAKLRKEAAPEIDSVDVAGIAAFVKENPDCRASGRTVAALLAEIDRLRADNSRWIKQNSDLARNQGTDWEYIKAENTRLRALREQTVKAMDAAAALLESLGWHKGCDTRLMLTAAIDAAKEL